MRSAKKVTAILVIQCEGIKCAIGSCTPSDQQAAETGKRKKHGFFGKATMEMFDHIEKFIAYLDEKKHRLARLAFKYIHTRDTIISFLKVPRFQPIIGCVQQFTPLHRLYWKF